MSAIDDFYSDFPLIEGAYDSLLETKLALRL